MSEARAIRAIPTRYKGVEFRSRLEARWAVFFENMGLDWIYEPEGFETPVGAYLPDFGIYYKGDMGHFRIIYFEVKPTRKVISNYDWNRMLNFGVEHSIVLLVGNPGQERQHPFFTDLAEIGGGKIMLYWEFFGNEMSVSSAENKANSFKFTNF